MITRNRGSLERGQALLLFTIVITVILSFLALVVDVGWAYYVGKKAQTAADAAALAAVTQAARQIGADGAVQCGGGIACQSSGGCPSTANLQVACQYAGANGFT